jgi:ribosomal protein S6--L-glutamate ligase
VTRRRFVVLGEPTGWHAARLAARLVDRGHDAAIVPWRMLAARIDAAGDSVAPPVVAAADAIVVRGMPGSSGAEQRLEEVIFRMNMLGRIASRGIPVINSPRSLEAAIDKHLSLCRLATAGLPVPRTIVVQDVAAARPARLELGPLCVAKPLFGSRGRGLTRIASDDDLAAAAAHPATAAGGVFYLQEFIPHDGWDVRIVLVGDRPFAMRRVAAAGEWRTNISCGGRGEPFEPPAAWVDLARRAAAALEIDVAGVDLLPACDGRAVVIEVNGVPGWRGLEAATGEDVTGAVADFLESRAIIA